MALRVLIVQSEAEAAQTLADLFARRGDEVIQAEEAAEVLLLTRRHLPDLLVMDLHLPGEDWLEALRYVRENHPDTKIILTNKYPDFRRELLAKEQGLNVFLRQPFTSRWLARALRRLPSGGPKPPSGGPKPKETRITPAPRPAHPGEAPASPGHGLPAVRLPLRVKITFPYTLLAVAFAVAAAYLVSRYVLESIRDRFNGQLIDAGKLAADWMVQEENRLLTSLRLLANLQGMADAIEVVSDHDAAQLRTLALPIAVNYQEEAVEILNLQGQSVLSLRHVEGGRVDEYSATEGETAFVQWPFVTQVLAQRTDRKGDKYAGLARAGWGDYFYVVGPVFDLDGDLAGAILVGKSLRSLAREIRQDTLAQISLYELNGQLLTSTLSGGEVVLPLTLAQASEALDRQDGESWTRELKIASVNYSEIVGPWEARGGEDLGLVGVSLAPAGNFLRPTLVTNVQAFVIVLATFLAVVAIGVYVANRITRPLLQMVRASTEVARGNLEIKVDPSGDDEVAVLAHAFNYMVSGLQEGSIYRDLLGRTVSP
ncbi:MAG: cache domain-containing protein, partial [Anaerolineales bacterium]